MSGFFGVIYSSNLFCIAEQLVEKKQWHPKESQPRHSIARKRTGWLNVIIKQYSA